MKLSLAAQGRIAEMKDEHFHFVALYKGNIITSTAFHERYWNDKVWDEPLKLAGNRLIEIMLGESWQYTSNT